MAATDPITDPVQALALLENAISPTTLPVLTEAQVTTLVDTIAASDDGAGGTQYTPADLNRAASLGWQWKAAAASAQFEAGVGTGKSFKLQQVYDHCMQMSAAYGAGLMSVVGSVDVDDGTGAPGRTARIGTLGITSVMNTETA